MRNSAIESPFGGQSMRKVNVRDVPEDSWSSPRGKFEGSGRGISEALGRKATSTDLMERHPFDLEILRIRPGKTPYPYHSHSAQWEFYLVAAGQGIVRHIEGTTDIEAGNTYIFTPRQPHQFTNDGSEDLIIYVMADNPIGESTYYPDSKKWGVRSPERKLLRGEVSDYYDGEE